MKTLYQVSYNNMRMTKIKAESAFSAIELAKTELNMQLNSYNGTWAATPFKAQFSVK